MERVMGIEPTTYSLGSCQSDFIIHPWPPGDRHPLPISTAFIADDLLHVASSEFTLVRTQTHPWRILRKGWDAGRQSLECLAISFSGPMANSPQPGSTEFASKTALSTKGNSSLPKRVARVTVKDTDARARAAHQRHRGPISGGVQAFLWGAASVHRSQWRTADPRRGAGPPSSSWTISRTVEIRPKNVAMRARTRGCPVRHRPGLDAWG